MREVTLPNFTVLSRVSRSWRAASLSHSRWRLLLPTQWARGEWSFAEARTTEAEIADMVRKGNSLGASQESLADYEEEDEEEEGVRSFGFLNKKIGVKTCLIFL